MIRLMPFEAAEPSQIQREPAVSSPSVVGGSDRTMAAPGDKIQDLQFLRGAAIVLVLCAHWMGTEATFRYLGFNNPGWIGVQLFFVLSGFVVTRSLQKKNFAVADF